jgi:hypothetical protein
MIPTPETIRRAGEILREIESLQSELGRLFGSGAPAVAGKRRGRPPGTGTGKRRKMSAEGRERIAAAARARWAKFHAEKSGKK